MSRSFRSIGGLLTAATFLAFLGMGQAARAQQDEEEEAAPAAPMNGVFMINNAQFDPMGIRQRRGHQRRRGPQQTRFPPLAERGGPGAELRPGNESPEEEAPARRARRCQAILRSRRGHPEEIRQGQELRPEPVPVRCGRIIQTLQTAFQAGVFDDESIFRQGREGHLERGTGGQAGEGRTRAAALSILGAGRPGDGAPEQQQSDSPTSNGNSRSRPWPRGRNRPRGSARTITMPSSSCWLRCPRRRSSPSSMISSIVA